MEFSDSGLLDSHTFPSPIDRRPGDKLGKLHKSSKVQKRAATDKRCTSCGTTSTPVWRWGGEAKEVLLCNACSLRIRRSATRPRAKSPTELSSQKQSPNIVSGESGSPQANKGLGELGPADAENLRLELLRCVEFHLGLEKARLLGPRDALAANEEWQSSQRQREPFRITADPMQGLAPTEVAPGYSSHLNLGQPVYSMSEALQVESRGPYVANDARHVHMI